MGTNVYLEWDRQTEGEMEAQLTGFSIDVGDRGYLRASIGMVRENLVLRELFPEKFREGCEGLEYDFKENWGKANIATMAYLLSEIFQLDVEPKGSQKVQVDLGRALFETIREVVGADSTELCGVSGGIDVRGSVMWANSLFDFFELGLKKQEEGLHPRVRISW